MMNDFSQTLQYILHPVQYVYAWRDDEYHPAKESDECD
jgi:hypothetical protein